MRKPLIAASFVAAALVGSVGGATTYTLWNVNDTANLSATPSTSYMKVTTGTTTVDSTTTKPGANGLEVSIDGAKVAQDVMTNGAAAVPITVDWYSTGTNELALSALFDSSMTNDPKTFLDYMAYTVVKVDSPTQCTAALAETTLKDPATQTNKLYAPVTDGTHALRDDTMKKAYYCVLYKKSTAKLPQYTNTGKVDGTATNGGKVTASDKWSTFTAPNPANQPEVTLSTKLTSTETCVG